MSVAESSLSYLSIAEGRILALGEMQMASSDLNSGPYFLFIQQ